MCVLFPECLFPERSEGVLGREVDKVDKIRILSDSVLGTSWERHGLYQYNRGVDDGTA